MTVRTIRSYFTELLTDSSIPYVIEGDSYTPSVRDSIVRVQVIPRESSNASIGIGGKYLDGGLVLFDIIAPRAGRERAEDLVDQLLTTIVKGSYQIEDGQLIIYTIWAESMREESAHIRIPVYVRYEQYR